MRKAFSKTLIELAESDPSIIFLTGDLGFGVFDEFISKFPKRYINVGVAEAQLVDCAAGLALEGWRPIVYSIASFMTGRAFEQIRIAIGYHKLPVVVVGAGGGYTYASSGVTHHAKEDLALMSLIPGMTVVCPGDPNEVAALLPQLIQMSTPSYLRVGRFGEPSFESKEPIKIGNARMLRYGDRVSLLTTGGTVIEGLEATKKLAEKGINPSLCHFHTIHPLDTQSLDILSARSKVFIIIEDHGIQGGLSSAVSQWCSSRKKSPMIVRLGPNDDLVLGNPKQEELKKYIGLDTASIVETCKNQWVDR